MIVGNFGEKVRVINVKGVDNVYVSEIIERSGLKTGMSLSDVSEQSVKTNLRKLASWECLSVNKNGGTVTIEMRGRVPHCVVHYAGNTYIVDEYCQTIERISGNVVYPYLELTGLEFGTTDVGDELACSDRNTVLSATDVLKALEASALYSHVKEINLADLDMIEMQMVEGYTVIVGDSTDMANKCKWIDAMLVQLPTEGKYSGTVDVSTGVNALYKPN